MKKILYISAFVPSENTAGQNYSKQLLHELSKFFIVDLYCFDSFGHRLDAGLCQKLRNIRIVRISKFNKLFGCLQLFFIHPMFTSRFSISLAIKLYRKIKTEKYDWVYLDFSQTFIYGLFALSSNKVLMCHDVIAQYYKRKHHYFSYVYSLFSERLLLKLNNSIVFSFSNKDQQLIKHHYSVDSMVTPFFISEQIINVKIDNEHKQYFSFFGAWNRTENIEGLLFFLDKVYSCLSIPFDIIIIGGGMPSSIQNRLQKFPNIRYMGFVPNPYNLLSHSIALLAPLFRGAGVKVKVVEAVACGCPVIGTEISFEGIPNSFDEMLYLADSPEQYVQIIETIHVPINVRMEYRNKMLSYCNEKIVLQYLLNN